jgi:hypothetical protein
MLLFNIFYNNDNYDYNYIDDIIDFNINDKINFDIDNYDNFYYKLKLLDKKKDYINLQNYYIKLQKYYLKLQKNYYKLQINN